MLGSGRISPRMVLRKSLHRFELICALLVVVVLTMTQLGATTHGYSHDAAARAKHQTSPSSHNPCDDCLAYAPLLSAVAAPPALPSMKPQGRSAETPPAAGVFLDISSPLAFRSRAPPVQPKAGFLT